MRKSQRINIDPAKDGVSHLNVYSRARTKLGRFLSNFSDCWIQTDDGTFRTIEGYWYWLSTNDYRLRKTNGPESKRLGRLLRGDDWPKDSIFELKIKRAIAFKMKSPLGRELLNSTTRLPLFHYYVDARDRAIHVDDGLWILAHMEEVWDEIQNETSL